jgi:hypothetical protein
MDVGFARRDLALAALALLACAACRARSDDPELDRVEFGVLFGGDIQDRAEIPLQHDAAQQELALRVTFRKEQTRERVVSFELERPTAQRAPDGGISYAAQLGEIRALPGERRAEAKLGFRRGDLPGPWRLLVRLDGRQVLERRFTVVEPTR